MAKRFTDTGKWDKAWFRKLSPTEKCVWMFLCDRCDHAGVWEVDMDALHFFVGTKWRVEDLITTFGEKVELRADEKLVVTGFIEFQYGDLNPDNRVHKSVLNRLEKLAPSKPLPSPLLGAKDKDKDKEKEKERGDARGENQKAAAALYARYPRKLGKADGIKRLIARFKAGLAPPDAEAALDRFLAHHKAKATEAEFLPYFSTWVGDLDDWLDPETGQAESFAPKVVGLSDAEYAAREAAIFEREGA